MGSSLKSSKFQALGAALALLVLVLASVDPGPPRGAFLAARLLSQPDQSRLLPVGGSAALIELPLLVLPVPVSPGADRSDSEVKGPAQHLFSGGAPLRSPAPVRRALRHQKRAGLFCGLPLGAHAPPRTA